MPRRWGWVRLKVGAFDWLHATANGNAVSLIDVIFDPLVGFAQTLLPRWIIFVLGFAVLWYSLSLIDHALPDMKLKASAFGGMARLLYRPIVTFGLGLAITSITMCVGVAVHAVPCWAIRQNHPVSWARILSIRWWRPVYQQSIHGGAGGNPAFHSLICTATSAPCCAWLNLVSAQWQSFC